MAVVRPANPIFESVKSLIPRGNKQTILMKTDEIDLHIPLSHVNSTSGWHTLLERVVHLMGCSTATLHRFDPGAGMLNLVVHVGVPATLLPKITSIPLGKGIAGAAAEGRKAIHLCNLQTDTSGVTCGDAKTAAVSGSLAVPVLNGEALAGTIGIGMVATHEFSDSETEQLWDIARWLAPALALPS